MRQCQDVSERERADIAASGNAGDPNDGRGAPMELSARTVICHEWVTTYGGSEQVASRIASVVGARVVHTFAVDEQLARRVFPDSEVVPTTRAGRTKFFTRRWQWLLPVMPWTWRRLDLSDYDVVITSSHACVNAVRVTGGAVHVSYCHTPMRYAWEWRSEINRLPALLRPLWPLAAAAFRAADRRWARRVTAFIANSRHIADRIRNNYGRRAVVVYPPVDVRYWHADSTTDPREDFYLLAGRLVPYKRPDVAMRAAAIAGRKLVIAGGGPELQRLRKIAPSGVSFIVEPDNETLRSLYRRARALVFPGVEDFGMTLVEAQACGTPVVALARGGACEAVVDGVTGVLYEDDSEEGLAAAILDFEQKTFASSALADHVRQFDTSRFDTAIRKIVAGWTLL